MLGLLFVEQRLLLALLLFQLGFLRGDLFARLFQLRDSLLTRLVQIAKVSLQALPALALFTAEDQLKAGVFTLAECGIKLCRKITFLRIALTFQFGNRRVYSTGKGCFVFRGACVRRRRSLLPAA